ncbi:MAG: sodium ion-translocating decarboxylase subunit beta, partial [Spirochaetia bacterium]|nr:sodium ion-translocating decarboxylase subunit beta [Spirochaetia bacterium]
MDFLLDGLLHTTYKHLIMYGVGSLLIYLAIAKKLEPSLLLPMGFGEI